MHRISVRIVLSFTVLLGMVWTAQAAPGPYDASRAPRGPERLDFARPNFMNRVHNAGKVCMNIVNYGYFGNEGYTQSTALTDPCPPENWAPQCEYPCGSGQQYLYQAGLWIGALIVEHGYETKRVSVGTDGWLNPSINEFWPGEGAANGIIERTKRPGYTNCLGEYVTDPNAISDQDFICTYTDTLNQTPYVIPDAIDGRHRPLGIKVTQTSYSFSQAFAEDFILIDYEIQNIAANFLKNLYVGLYVDADIGLNGYFDEHTDDICGFLQNYYETNGVGQTITTPIDVAWIADNDGRHPNQNGSGALSVPNIAGTRVIRGPNPRLTTSFNWWISNGDVTLDYGPSWEDYCSRDSMGMGWTQLYGTPMGDEHKYQVLSNGEFDFWQIMVDRMDQVSPQNIGSETNPILKNWCTSDPSPQAANIANGYDTRYLLSWGPLGIRDYQDASGRWIYRLNPGEKFNMTIAYVCGQNFHDATHPQPSNETIDSSLFNFADLRENARWAKDVYDNRMRDTPQWDWGNDGDPNVVDDDGSQGDDIMDTGDGWYGEDVGRDGLYAELKPGEDSVKVFYFKGRHGPNDPGIEAGWYSGPDADGSERNGLNDGVNNAVLGAASEDSIILMQDTRTDPFFYNLPKMGFWDMGYMGGNGLVDLGDGIPDFTGPPPPPIPALMHCMDNTANSAANFGGQIRHGCYVGGIGYQLEDDKVKLLWSTTSSERADYRDPFSRVQDFEGYRIHVANTNQDPDFSLLAEFDRIDYAYYSGTDSLMTMPISPEAYADSIAHGKLYATIANGAESPIGEPGTLKAVGLNTGFGQILLNDSTYQFTIPAHKLSPRYYAITAFDYGDPKSGLGPLSTRPTANSVLLAPAGSAKEPVRAVPNPYRAYQDYTQKSGGTNGISWENMNDGTTEFFQQQDRRIEFINLPEQCLIRIFTVSGDLVSIIPHNQPGDKSSWASLNSERWDLNSRNKQQVVSGIYLFSVEDRTPANGHQIETGKFVIIR
jgi:hypothetical protein